ncbi:MAG: DNA-protecting protein DprA [Bacteroidetes bacterium]|nr:DNA-protecting protein DprA [Bacteroidota bacterium]
METSNQIFKIAFANLHGIGPSRGAQLISKIGSVEEFFSLKSKELYLRTGIAKTIIQNLNRDEAMREAEKQFEYNQKHTIKSHFFLDSDYPRRLKQCPDQPMILFSKGNVNLNQERIVSIVGTRNQTEYGAFILEDLIHSFVENNVLVVSGLAYGVDISAHRLCIDYGISTLGVLGHGLDRIYPAKHKNTAIKMIEQGGLLTEFSIGTNPDRENFPMRNRIVAGIADATIVIESKAKGGSMITAELANDYNRDVFAFPGDIKRLFSEGCNMLIRQEKAHLITDGADFLKFMNWNSKESKPEQKELFEHFDENEKQILEILSNQSDLHMDVLSIRTGISASKMNVILFNLEMKSAVKHLSGRRYRLATSL